MAAKIIPPVSMRLTPMTAKINNSCVMLAKFIRKTKASVPPNTLIRNSTDCMPKMPERLTGAGTFWSLR